MSNHSEKLNSCPVCGNEVYSRVECVMDHFAFYQPGQLQYWRGNIAAFGIWSGLLSSICLSFPFINILIHWRHRKSRLVIEALPDDQAGGGG